MSPQKFYMVDAFIDPNKPFSGNPAAVVFLQHDYDISDEHKQRIAAQFNLSETMFVWPSGDHFAIRFFTPSTEVDLCGHGTLATSHVLYKESHELGPLVAGKPIAYRTNKGAPLECAQEQGQLVLDFPLNAPVKLEADQHPWIDTLQREMLGAQVDVIDVQWSQATKKLLLRVHHPEEKFMLTQLRPDFNRLLQMNTSNMVRGLIVTQKANLNRDGVHFWSRYFSPWNGINEDPVTGASFTAPYWKNFIQDDVLIAKQVSPRSGLIQCQIVKNRVKISGKAKTFCSGQFQI